MTHRDKSALRGLIEELLAVGGQVDHGDAMRRLLEAGLQELIEAEVSAVIGAGRYERTSERSTHRNGVQAKQLATPAGQVELAIPKLRTGSFFPSLLEPRRRIDQALWAVIAQAWIQGVSTRRVDQLVKRWATRPGSPARRCRGSVPRSTSTSRCSWAAASIRTTPATPTCAWTPPTWTSAVREALAADHALMDPRKWMGPARSAVEVEVQRLLALRGLVRLQAPSPSGSWASVLARRTSRSTPRTP